MSCNIGNPCWENYIYIGPKPRAKGSCISKEKLCKKKENDKNFSCKEQLLKEKKISCDNTPLNKEKNIKTNNLKYENYKKCLEIAEIKFNENKLRLCPRGYCTAKHKFDVYPSAYANGHASGICKGKYPDLVGNKKVDNSYIKKLNTREKEKNSLQRWFDEEWVNLCETGDGPGGFARCGTGEGIENLDKYPYCRAYKKLENTDVITVEELKKYLTEDKFNKLIDNMCKKKRSKEQGIDGKPTRTRLPIEIYKLIKKKRKEEWLSKKMHGGKEIRNEIFVDIPIELKKEAEKGNRLIRLGFKGGTQTGWDRGNQLEKNKKISLSDLADMRTWFARHGPDASHGGTSYKGYCNWINNNSPGIINEYKESDKKKYRGAVSWLIWGGNSAYLFLKKDKIRKLLEKEFPGRAKSPKNDNLGCNQFVK